MSLIFVVPFFFYFLHSIPHPPPGLQSRSLVWTHTQNNEQSRRDREDGYHSTAQQTNFQARSGGGKRQWNRCTDAREAKLRWPCCCLETGRHTRCLGKGGSGRCVPSRDGTPEELNGEKVKLQGGSGTAAREYEHVNWASQWNINPPDIASDVYRCAVRDGRKECMEKERKALKRCYAFPWHAYLSIKLGAFQRDWSDLWTTFKASRNFR